jgi:hypothetical protein
MACAKLNSLSSQWIANNPFSSRRGSSAAPRGVSLRIRASYSDELVQTAVSIFLYSLYYLDHIYLLPSFNIFKFML